MKALKNDARLLQMGILLRKLRLDKGYTSAEKFSNEHGINRTLYQRWENGKDMRLSSLFYLCDIHELELDQLFVQVTTKVNL